MLGWFFVGVTLYYIFFPGIAPKVLTYTTSVYAFLCLGLVLYFLTKWGFSALINIGLDPEKEKKKKKK